MATTTSDDKNESKNRLSFTFRQSTVPVTYPASISQQVAQLAVDSEIFKTWVERCEREHQGKKISLHSVEIQSVDLFGPRIGFVKIKADCTLVDGVTKHEKRLPGICFLRGGSVAILVALVCEDEGGKVYSLLVEQPRIPIGQVSCLELPAGMIDNISDGITGTAAKEMEEECGIKVRPSEMIDLTELACQRALDAGHIPSSGIAPSPGGSDEIIRYLYFERTVTKADLDRMRGRLAGLRDHGEYITLRVVPMDDIWKISCDAKAICALFLMERLRNEGKINTRQGTTSTTTEKGEPTLTTVQGLQVPTLAFGMYKIPATEEGLKSLDDAIKVGYRHFDTASLYGNEHHLGQAIKNSKLPRNQFTISSKVWNDAQKDGRAAVRKSVERSISALDCGTYIDILYIHWPVPGRFVDSYRELQELYREGKIRQIGLSNFGIKEYEELVSYEDITVPPSVNQIEVSPFMYRPETIQYFQDRGILIASSKALHRADGLGHTVVTSIAQAHDVTPAQILLRWNFQKRLIVVTKTGNVERMKENRDILTFHLSPGEMDQLDSLTSKEDIRKREALEIQRRNGV